MRHALHYAYPTFGCALILTSFISTTTSDSAGTEPRIASHIGGQFRRQATASQKTKGIGSSGPRRDLAGGEGKLRTHNKPTFFDPATPNCFASADDRVIGDGSRLQAGARSA